MQDHFLSKLGDQSFPVIDPSYAKNDYYPLDLSITNAKLDIDLLTRPHDHHAYLQKFLKGHHARVAYGGYLEKRPLYDRSDYFQADDPKDKRNIHLGIDLWCDSGTNILSPLEGEVHSFQVNKNFGDYGPTIVLQHTIQNEKFFTLYGHLSLESLEDKQVGKKVIAGQVIAKLGTPEVNGDYAPHLHFQIIKDLQGMTGDYPGVCSNNDLEFYRHNCPDPNLLLGIY